MSVSPALSEIGRLIRGRRSVRRFHSEPVPSSADLENLLALATWAPSAHNRQPWRLVVLRDAVAKERLAQRMGDRLRTERTADGADPADVEADARRSHTRLTQAPVIIVLCLTVEEMDRYPDPRRVQAERTMAVQSTAMAGQNLMLAAHAAGWGSCWMCAPLFAPEEVRSALDLPEAWEPQGAIVLGAPIGEVPPRPRRGLSEVVRWM